MIDDPLNPVVRVLSVPSAHQYVQNLSVQSDARTAAISTAASSSVVRLPDPVPAGATQPGQWWPPAALDGDWLREHRDEFDLLHVHFGTESFSTPHLVEVLRVLDELRIPLVYTVHDLANPQLTDQSLHLEHLDLLVARATEVITLTQGAAAEIEHRFGRVATVIPHPNIWPLEEDFPTDAPTVGPLVVGIHLRDVRPNIDAERATATLDAATALLREDGIDVVARVDLNDRVRDERIRDRVRALAPTGALLEHPRYSDLELAESLVALDVSVLPYSHGTHSGWVELCWDLGVAVAAPTIGHFARQHPQPDFCAVFTAGDARSLADALSPLLVDAALLRARRSEVRDARRAERRLERERIAAEHDLLYRRALATVATATTATTTEEAPLAEVLPCRAADPLRIAVIAPLRFPISLPHAGGLESSIWNQVRALRERGHRVVLCAAEGSDYLAGGPDEFVMPAIEWPDPSEATDSTYPDGYLDRAFAAMDRALAWVAANAEHFDIVDNHCLHGLPLTWADSIRLPMVSTLHTPTLPAMLAAHRSTAEPRSSFLAVSEHTAAEWAAEGIDAQIVPNAVDTDTWRLGPGGEDLVWFGRLVPEKGAHLALAAARLVGRRIVFAGRIGDADYFAREIAPHLGENAHYAGALDQPQLADLVGASACALVTPVWEEPFGLVIAEAMATGTPVATFRIGGVPEVVGEAPGTSLVATGDVAALAEAVVALIRDSSAELRQRTRDEAVARFSLRRRAIDLEAVYRRLIDERARGTASDERMPRAEHSGVVEHPGLAEHRSLTGHDPELRGEAVVDAV